MSKPSRHLQCYSKIPFQGSLKIGEKLQSLLLASGMTQTWLAQKSGISLKSVQRHLRNFPVRRDISILYAKTFRVDINELSVEQSKNVVTECVNNFDKYLDWLIRDLQHLPQWPYIGSSLRPSLDATYVDPIFSRNEILLNNNGLFKHRFTIISGPAGIGKSTYLQALATNHARSSDLRIPILIRMGDLANYIEKKQEINFLSFIKEHFRNIYCESVIEELHKKFELGEILLLFDDFQTLKKFSSLTQDNIMKLINNLPRDYPLIYVMLSYRDTTIHRIIYKFRHEYKQIKLQCLNPEQRFQIIKKIQHIYSEKELAHKLQKTLKLTPQLEPFMSTPLDLITLLLSTINEAKHA